MSTVGYIYVQVGILVSARTRLLPWQWEVPVSSSLAETGRRLGRLWGRSSLRVTVLTSFTWSWTWPTCSLWESSARTSSKERRDSTSWSTMQVTTKQMNSRESNYLVKEVRWGKVLNEIAGLVTRVRIDSSACNNTFKTLSTIRSEEHTHFRQNKLTKIFLHLSSLSTCRHSFCKAITWIRAHLVQIKPFLELNFKGTTAKEQLLCIPLLFLYLQACPVSWIGQMTDSACVLAWTTWATSSLLICSCHGWRSAPPAG